MKLLAMVVALSAAGAAVAQTTPDYPAKPVTLVVPYAAGGATDVIARILGQQLGEIWKQPVVVTNRPGAGTVLGAGQVAKAAGDGYTLYMTTAAHTISASLYKSLPYDPYKDFAPINLASVVPLVLVTASTLPAKDLQAVLAMARAQPGMTYASPGNGSPQHLAGALLKSKAGLELTHVPYKGDAPMLTDLMSGQVQMAFVTLSSALPHIKTGKLRPIALAHDKRSQVLPDVPTFAQAGMSGFQAATWFGLFTPASVAPALKQKLAQDVAQVVARPDVAARLAEMGGEATNAGPKEFAAFIEAEGKRWAEAVRLSGARVE
ncbi:tripartite tricarboxylate transporter substrate binding protein [Noviherbaspirillum sp. Root189]|uniref:tripartite tricarboxylate transporter substrate binding protein n=1 Tax=Noviherbaspirillum sp. Root189 TaxID=1736487 RepID=UPI001F37F528|nr:tripartite tricarboxylate transporter substrate binding protein [Noviherbaspirillum sp. Root189]